jgi:carbon-monoxide dehydrogenase large subunit
MAGTVICRAADDIIAQGRVHAADMLEAAASDLRFEDGRYVVAGTDRAVEFLDVARRACAAGQPLASYQKWTRQWLTYPNGAHVVEVEIDRETGAATLARYTALDDYGVIVNPMVVAGQVHGSIAQGVGQALMEQVRYDRQNGQPLSASLMDYAMPRADDMPLYDLSFNASPCTTNPLGVKGVGESGALAALPAITNAIDDALTSVGAAPLDLPPTPERIWRRIATAGRAGGSGRG